MFSWDFTDDSPSPSVGALVEEAADAIDKLCLEAESITADDPTVFSPKSKVDRHKVVYPLLSEKGDELCWFGRDPQYEDRHKKWEQTGKADQELRKFQFVVMTWCNEGFQFCNV